jgi:peptidoglycan-N-acetylglucosamine deacetylase
MRMPRSLVLVFLGMTTLLTGLALLACGTARPDPAQAVGALRPMPAGGHPSRSTIPSRPARAAVTTSPVARAPIATGVSFRTGAGPAGSLMSSGTDAVALTFDDGADPTQTPRLLDLLAAEHVTATFCLVGQNVQAHPEVVRQIVAGGHTLCDHTYTHDEQLGRKSSERMRSEMQRTLDAIHAAAPGAPVKYFRAPAGNYTPAMVAMARRLGMTSLYWSADPRDWDHPGGETEAVHQHRVITSVLRQTHRGGIVLSHDFQQPGTIDAYRTIIPALKQKYRLAALP